MCIAIYSPQDVVVPRSHLYQSFQHNPDGAGFMYAENDQLHIEKGFMDFDKFYEAYKPHKEKPVAIHFRITTHGLTDETNTHPFRVGPNLGFIHNGVISNVDCSADKDRSDTYHFNTKYLSQFYKRDSRFIFKNHFKDVIKSYVGSSKLIFLNNKGHHTIVNEKAGLWEEGVWYSNGSFRTYKPIVHTAPQQPKQQPKGVLKQGQRVVISHPQIKGQGVISHFTGGTMVGVQLEGETNTSLIPMACLEPWIDLHDNPFQRNDWVCRKGDYNKIGQVIGTSKNRVWLKWLDEENGEPDGPTFEMNATNLELWSYLMGV